jgi:RHH-type rel operon transcriptional repressor/antitoxin RelB
MLAIRLPAEVESRLDTLARTTGRTKTFYARQAILEHLGDLEDAYLAEQRLLDIRSGKAKPVPLEEVARRQPLAERLGAIANELAAIAKPGGRGMTQGEIDAMWGHT